MADEEENLTVKGEIINAIRSLCIQTETTYVNFFDRRTCNSENLTRPLGRVRYIIPTGSYALGEWEHGDDVHLVALTPVSRDVCWPALLEKLDIHHGKFTTFTDDLALSAPSLSRTKPGEQSLLADFVTLSRKNKAGCKFYLHYCKVPPSFDTSKMGHEMIPTNKQQEAAAQGHLNLLRDYQYLARATNDLDKPEPETFAKAYRELRSWMEAFGLFGPKLGHFNDECIIWLVHGAYDALRKEEEEITADEEKAALAIITKHFHTKMHSTTSKSDRLEIKTHTQRLVSREITPEAQFALECAVKDTRFDMQRTADQKYSDNLKNFIADFEPFLTIECTSWTPTMSQKTLFTEDTIPQNIKAVMKFLREHYVATTTLKDLRTRLWSVPIVEDDQESRYIYVVGLMLSPRGQGETKSLSDGGSGIAADIQRENVLSFPADISLITVAAATGADVYDLLRGSDTSSVGTALSNLSLDGSRVREQAAPPSGGRFRTASEAMNRLRHDPAHASVEYDLAYVDRFEGIMWMGLEDWGRKATEDLDWIPAHRVRQLRRREDRVVVWDRVARVDRTDL